MNNTLLNEIKNNTPISWEKLFEDSKNELSDISKILENQDKQYGKCCCPELKDVFNAFHLTPLNSVKIVIFGNQPYCQSFLDDQRKDVGLAYSVRREDLIPQPLKNIYSELKNSINTFDQPGHGDLTNWCKKGVLLLNISLTVRLSAPSSHGDIWLGFIKRVIKAIELKNPQCIYFLWGQEVKKISNFIGNKSIILETSHPSAFSANRGFFGCDHFATANKILLANKKTGIDWNLSSNENLCYRKKIKSNQNLRKIDKNIL